MTGHYLPVCCSRRCWWQPYYQLMWPYCRCRRQTRSSLPGGNLPPSLIWWQEKQRDDKIKKTKDEMYTTPRSYEGWTFFEPTPGTPKYDIYWIIASYQHYRQFSVWLLLLQTRDKGGWCCVSWVEEESHSFFKRGPFINSLTGVTLPTLFSVIWIKNSD